MTRTCFICRSKKTMLFLRTKERSLYQCGNCNLIFVWPIPDRKDLKQLYGEEYFNLQKEKVEITGYRSYQDIMPLLTPYFRKKLTRAGQLLGKKGKLLDIGCALGLFLEIAKADGWDVLGLDISSYAVKEVRKRGIKAVNCDLFNAKLKKNSFDLVTIFQTIEHDSNPVRLLREIKRILKPGGVLIITTPNAKGLPSQLLGKRWHGWRRRSHLFWLDKNNLKLALDTVGLKIIEIGKDDHIRGSLFDIFETLNRSYKSPFISFIYVTVNRFPNNIKLKLKMIPQPPFGDIVAFAGK